MVPYSTKTVRIPGQTFNIPQKQNVALVDNFANALQIIGIMMIQLEMVFDHKLNADRLIKAARLLFDAEPVLGSRLVYRWWRNKWVRLANIDEKDFFLQVDNEKDYLAFRDSTISANKGPQVKLCLWPGESGDRLLLKMSHQAGDAGGVKHASRLLAKIYSKLDADPQHTPIPNIDGSREIIQFASHIPFTAYPQILINYFRETIAGIIPKDSVYLQLPEGPKENFGYIVADIESDRVREIADYGRERGATLNDVFMAAVFRVIKKRDSATGSAALRMFMTYDLRKWYLPGGVAGGICNLSSVELPGIGNKVGETFEDTLKLVNDYTSARKASWPGVNGLVTLPFAYLLPHALLTKFMRGFLKALRSRMAPGFTNMGPIETEDVDYQGMAVEARLLVPPGNPGVSLLGLSGYAGSLTLTAGAYSTNIEPMQELIAEISAELPS